MNSTVFVLGVVYAVSALLVLGIIQVWPGAWFKRRRQLKAMRRERQRLRRLYILSALRIHNTAYEARTNMLKVVEQADEH
jgi:hypothetical protein